MTKATLNCGDCLAERAKIVALNADGTCPTCDRKANVIKHAYIARARNSWGKGESQAVAIKRLRKEQRGIKRSEIRVYRVHANTTVDSIGNWVYDLGFAPQEIDSKGRLLKS